MLEKIIIQNRTERFFFMAILLGSLAFNAVAQASPVIKVRVDNRDKYYQIIRYSYGMDVLTANRIAGSMRYQPPGENTFRLGNLASLESPEHSAVIQAFRSRGVEVRDVWLGGYRTSFAPLCTLDWFWIGHQRANSIVWAPGEPNNPAHPLYQQGYNNCSSPFYENQMFIKTREGLVGNIVPTATRGQSNLQMGFMVGF